ncbi:MAG: hypothetical protein ABIY51_14985, partial [Ferruginibacter sp.]
MKIFLVVIAHATIFFSQNSIAQNVGVGTATPLSKFHVFNGASGATPFFSTALAVESNTNTYLNLLSPAVNETAILFGVPASSANGVIMYNTPGTPNGFQFRNNGNLTRMVIDNAGYMGIGTTTPGNLLEIKNSGATTPGLRINNTTATWQLGVGINTANDALFGIYNSSAGNAFVINNSGNVGIGNTNPGYLLDVNKRMRIRSGGDLGTTAGIWLNKTDNTALQSFIGIEDNNYVGFYGLATGWKFCMNTQTGALKINGSEGQAGQVLQSTGAGTAPTWISSATVHYIGESYGGGIVFYVYDNGQHGLIAATADQSTGIQWANNTNITNAVR